MVAAPPAPVPAGSATASPGSPASVVALTHAAALDGKVYKFSLAEALKKGPVVLYFFPAAFSEGCSVEARRAVVVIIDLR